MTRITGELALGEKTIAGPLASSLLTFQKQEAQSNSAKDSLSPESDVGSWIPGTAGC